jgi:hypothetical protein
MSAPEIHPTGICAPVHHELKTWPEFFGPIITGEKTFEFRKDDGRNFQVGDTLELREWSPASMEYTGRHIAAEITYTLRTMGVPPGYVVLGIKTAATLNDLAALIAKVALLEIEFQDEYGRLEARAQALEIAAKALTDNCAEIRADEGGCEDECTTCLIFALLPAAERDAFMLQDVRPDDHDGSNDEG